MNDYYLHFLFGLFLSSLGLKWRPLVLTGFFAGVLKETFDYIDYGIFDIKDMWYTFAGAAIGTVIVFLIVQKK